MASYASTAYPDLSSFKGTNGGFGAEPLANARAAGYTDDQIRGWLQQSGTAVGPKAQADLYGNGTPAVNNQPSVAGALYDQGLSGLTELGNKYKGNETVGGLVTGALIDSNKTTLNTANAIQYNDAFLGSLANYQTGIENNKTGNTATLMGLESGLSKDLLQAQGTQTRLNTAAEGKAQLELVNARGVADNAVADTQGKYSVQTADTQGKYSLQGIQAQGVSNERVAGIQGSYGLQTEQARGLSNERVAGIQGDYSLKGITEQGASNERVAGIQGQSNERVAGIQGDYSLRGITEQGASNERVAGIQGSYNVQGIKEQGASNERVAGIQGDYTLRNTAATGEQNRLSQDNESANVIRLRDQARNSIRSQGARFYG